MATTPKKPTDETKENKKRTQNKRFVDARHNLGLTAIEVEKILGYKRSAIQAIECGKNMPRADALKKIAQLYRVSADYLLGNSNRPFSYDKIADENPYISHIYYEVMDLKSNQKALLEILDFIIKVKNRK